MVLFQLHTFGSVILLSVVILSLPLPLPLTAFRSPRIFFGLLSTCVILAQSQTFSRRLKQA
jgi:hypothetical protein